ncbi:MAG: hypothetical protein CFE29_22255 [Bradyrhizobiaceae bacterium PARB1]|nr:MAG: hypothetical protein CFE29_22255 [Bradyrhizobiaceae bacterium PARB1]
MGHSCRNIETVPYRYLHHLSPELEGTVSIQGQSKLTFFMEVDAERREHAPRASGIFEAGAATLTRILPATLCVGRRHGGISPFLRY